MSQSFDFLVVLTFAAVKEKATDAAAAPAQAPLQSSISQAVSMDNKQIESVGKIIELSWVQYDLTAQLVAHEKQFYIRHEGAKAVSKAALEQCNVNLDAYTQNAVPLQTALEEFNDFVYTTIIRTNKAFSLVTYGDHLLSRLLPHAAAKAGIKLAPHFFQYFDVVTEFKKFVPNAAHLSSLHEMLVYTNLKEKENTNETHSQAQCKNVVRIVNMLVRQGHVFTTQKILNMQHNIIVDTHDEKNRYVMSRQKKSKKNYIRGRTPSPFKNPTRGYFVRLKGLPYNCQHYEIFEFLRGIRVYKEDIAIQYDGDGRNTGEVYVRLHSESDKREAMLLNIGALDRRHVDVHETSETEWNAAKLSQFPDKRERIGRYDAKNELEKLAKEAEGFVFVKGLSSATTEEDIRKFFAGLQIVEGGIKRAVRGRRPTTECYIAFRTKDDTAKALALHTEKMGKNFIEVQPATVRELETYLAQNFNSTMPVYSKDRMPQIQADKRRSTLLIMGLPYNATNDQIRAFFKEYEVQDRDMHILLTHTGRPSGNALITFEDELEAQRALKQKNYSYIGNRYIELYEYK